MKYEIERKFTVKEDDAKELIKQAFKTEKITQSYLGEDPEIRVRVNELQQEARITIKSSELLKRQEYEYKIPYQDGLGLLKLCRWKLQKIRYHLTHGEHVWTLDQFLEDLSGLWLAEVELFYEDQKFLLPDWVQEEVTYDLRYKNVNLVKSYSIGV